MKFRFVIISVICFIIFSNLTINSLAMNTGFETSNIDNKKAEEIFSNINISTTDTEKTFESIACFDISDNGLIAIGIDNSTDKFINIYNENKVFLYGYSFEDNGKFGFEFSDDNIIIYFVKGDIAVLIDKEGNFLEMESISDTIDNNSYWNNVVFAKTKQINNYEYYLTNPNVFLKIFAPSYSQLIQKHPNGTENIIFDKSADYMIIIIMMICVITIFIAIIIIALIRLLKKTGNHN